MTALARLLLAGWLLAACGVPLDASPREIDPDRVPFGLLEPDQPGSTTVPQSMQASAEVYLVRGDRLVAVVRDVPTPPTAEKAVMALLRGPTDEEAKIGLRTAITTTGGVSVSGPEDGLVRIELGRSFATSGAGDQVLGLAQLVFTVTALPEASRVLFTVSGRPVEVPAGDGTLTGSPLGRENFRPMAP